MPNIVLAIGFWGLDPMYACCDIRSKLERKGVLSLLGMIVVTNEK